MMPHYRKFLQDQQDGLSPSITYSPDPLNQPINGSSIINSRPIKPNMPFDSSMALTILVLFTALFFMGFFSIYIRRFADTNSAAVDLSGRRRQNQGDPPRQSFLPSRFNPQKGLDPSTIRSLPLVHYGGAAKYPIDCVICLTEFEERETVKLIPYCRHVFHPTCIDTWLASHGSCPLCRSSQLFKPFEEVCLGVGQTSIVDGVSDLEGRSTVVDVNSCREEVGTVGMSSTRIEPFEGICLGVERSSIGDGVSNLEGRSTVVDVDTCREDGREVGTVGITVRRTSSCSSLGDHTVLQTTTSV